MSKLALIFLLYYNASYMDALDRYWFDSPCQRYATAEDGAQASTWSNLDSRFGLV